MEKHNTPDNMKKCLAKLDLFKNDLKRLSLARPDDNEVQYLFKFFDTIITFEGEKKTETNKTTPFMKKFFSRLIDIKEAVKDDMKNHTDVKTLRSLQNIYNQLNDLIKVNREDLP